MLAGSGRAFDVLGMAIRLHTHDDGIDARVVYDVVRVFAVLHAKVAGCLPATFGVVVPGSNELDIIIVQQGAAVCVRVAVRVTENTDPDPVLHFALLYDLPGQ
jgi:hypothetical protein